MAGAQSDVATLRRVVVRHARDAFHSDTAIDRQWRDLNYLARPDFARAVAEYDGFVELLRDGGAAVHALPADGTVGLDSIYVRDASIACDRGVILCSMGKPQRAAEPAATRWPSRRAIVCWSPATPRRGRACDGPASRCGSSRERRSA